MNAETTRLLDLSYEIEGLLLLANSRGSETPDRIWQIIAEKAETISQSAKVCKSETSITTDLHGPELTDDSQAANEAEIIQNLSGEHFRDDVFSIDELEVKQASDMDMQNPHCETVHDIDVAETPATARYEEQVAEKHSDSLSEGEDADKQSPDFDIHDCPDEMQSQSDSADAPAITLDEKLAREQSRCLRKAFSLNDRFRFRRELFGNSDTEFADALNMLEAMGNLAEANDYFYGDLQWDPENPEVIDFMQIVTKHFQGK